MTRTFTTWLACALALSGCGAWLEGSVTQVGVGARLHASGTARVEAGASGSGAIEIVEQAAGAGFVVESAGSAGGVATVDDWGSSSISAGGLGVAAQGGAWEPGAPAGTLVLTGGGAAGTTHSAGGAGNVSGNGGGAINVATATGGAGGVGGGVGGNAGVGSPGVAGTGVASNDSTGVAGTGVASNGSTGVASDGAAGSVTTTSIADAGRPSVADPMFGGGAALDVEVAAAVPRDGVHGLDGRPTSLTALLGLGLQVDGVRVRLADLEALANLPVASATSARLRTDEAVEAYAELEHAQLPRAGGETHLVVRLRGNPALEAPRAPLRVHLVLDRSSSMQRSWQQILAAARMLIGRLAPQDELHIVAYGTDAIEALPVGRVGDGQAARRALDGITVGGGTNIEAGLELAYRAGNGARSLVILLSDGVPNHGAFEPAELGALAARARAEHGCTTSVIGLGTEFDARLLRTVASEGRGGYHVSASLDRLADGLVAELDRHARLAARAVRVRVELPAGVTLIDAGASGAEVVDGAVVLAMPRLDAGEERSLVLRIRVPASRQALVVGRVALDYRSGLGGAPIAASRELELSFGARAVRAADGQAAMGVIDAGLAAALDLAGEAILDGRGAQAAQALRAHVGEVEGRVELAHSPLLAARGRVLSRLAEAFEVMGSSATHPQRRSLALALGSLAVRISR